MRYMQFTTILPQTPPLSKPGFLRFVEHSKCSSVSLHIQQCIVISDCVFYLYLLDMMWFFTDGIMEYWMCQSNPCRMHMMFLYQWLELEKTEEHEMYRMVAQHSRVKMRVAVASSIIHISFSKTVPLLMFVSYTCYAFTISSSRRLGLSFSRCIVLRYQCLVASASSLD